MAIILGGVTLSNHMLWVDEFETSQGVVQTFKRTLGGAPVVISKDLYRGTPITLVATEAQGWLTKAQVQAIHVLANQAGSVLSLTVGSMTASVLFRHHERPAFEAEPLNQIGAQAPAGYYTATIKLMTV